MNKCWNCGVEFVDPTNVCPLCKCITERDGDEVLEKKPTYPFHPGKEIKKIQLALSIYTLAAIIAEVILVIVDFHVGDRVHHDGSMLCICIYYIEIFHSETQWIPV